MTNLNAANISKLIWYMEGLDDPLFDMEDFFHGCGTPSCALGWAATIPEFEYHGPRARNLYGEMLDFSVRVFGGDAYDKLFHAVRNEHIRTPQQWALHARKVLAEAGLEVVPNAAGQEAEAARPSNEVNTCPAAPYDFQAFMRNVLEPMKERSGTDE